GAKEGLVGPAEVLRLLVAHRDTDRQGKVIVVERGVVPYVGSAVGAAGLAEGPGGEGHVKVGPGVQRLQDVQVDIFREGTAVVVGEIKGGHPLSLGSATPERVRRRPCRSRGRRRIDTNSSRASPGNRRPRSSG